MHRGIITMHDNLRDTLELQFPGDPYLQDSSYQTDNLMIISNLNATHMPMQFVDPTAMILAADSAYLADTCGMSWQTLRLQFAD